MTDLTAAPAVPVSKRVKKWEYLVLDFDDYDKSLNEVGAEGWELVTVVYAQWENERKGFEEDSTICYFKREVVETLPKER